MTQTADMITETTRQERVTVITSVDLEALRANPAMVRALFERLKVTVDHPTLRLPNTEQLIELLRTQDGQGKLRARLAQREQLIKLMEADPLRYGYEPEAWRDADRLLQELKDLLVLGGNRAAKSEWAAKRCVQKLIQKEGAIVWCLSTTDKTSIRDQQKLIWKYMPPEWKALNRKKIGKARISYDQKNGFAEGAFVCPNGSEMQFMNYKQDRDVIEGGQVDLWWADELVPVDWVVTLRGRTIDRHGKGIITFTPIRGCSPTVAEYITGSKVTAWRECELLQDQKLWPGGQNGQVPYTLHCLNPTHGVIFFQSKDNPFIDYEELKKVWAKRSRADILVRLHGVTDKRRGTVFPRYGVHNIVAHGKIPIEGTNYMFGDFAWNRKWFLLWFRCWEVKGKKRIFIYREWPDFETYGEWALPAEAADGERGPAQETLGYSINDYKRLILTLEGHELAKSETRNQKSEEEKKPEEIFMRFGDPRSGAAQNMQIEETVTILDMLNEPTKGLPDLEVKPVRATGERRFIGEGVNLFNEWLEYDEDRELGMDNEPMLYISDRCRNVADCLKLWTGAGGEKGASKDPIDLCRYARIMDIEHVPPGAMLVTGGMG